MRLTREPWLRPTYELYGQQGCLEIIGSERSVATSDKGLDGRHDADRAIKNGHQVSRDRRQLHTSIGLLVSRETRQSLSAVLQSRHIEYAMKHCILWII